MFGLTIFSLFIGCCWLALPLMCQIIIDKVISQNSIDTLGYLATSLILTFLIASGCEIILESLITSNLNSSKKKLENRQIFTKLPRVIVLLVISAVYSPNITILLFLYLTITIFVFYQQLCKTKTKSFTINDIRQTSLSYSLPLHYYHCAVIFPSTILVCLGAYLVLDGKLTLGQLIALNIIALQIMSLCLSLIINLAKLRGNSPININLKI